MILNIDCGHSLEPPRRGSSTSAHNQCFEKKIKQISKIHSLIFFIFTTKKSLHIAWACFRNEIHWCLSGFIMFFVVELLLLSFVEFGLTCFTFV